MLHLLRLRMQDGMIDKMRYACLAGLPKYYSTNNYLIGTHIGTDMIDRSHPLHRRTDGGIVAHITHENLSCPQRFHNRNIFLAMHERRKALHFGECLNESSARFTAGACD